MSVGIKVYKNTNTSNMATCGKYYGRAAVSAIVGTKDLAELIQENCSVKKSDVLAVLTELKSAIKQQLRAGQCVRLEGLGSFRISISTVGVDSPEEFSIDDITNTRILFKPERTMKKVNGTRSDGKAGQVRKYVTDVLEGIEFKLLSSMLTDAEIETLAGRDSVNDIEDEADE